MTSNRHGPLRSNRFKVELDGITIGGFKKVEIPSQRTEQIEYREGNQAAHQKRLWGKTQYEDLVMVRGAKSKNKTLYNWRLSVEQGKMQEARKNISVTLLDEAGESRIRWNFTNAWPKQYDPPTLDSGSGGESVATERYIITFDEMERKDL